MIIVVCHTIPPWADEWKKRNVVFIRVISELFDILRRFDEQDVSKKPPVTLKPPPRVFHEYLKLGGEYHNKDKGLKYFIGLLYCFLLPPPKQPEFIAFIDGDDFIHTEVGKWLQTRSKGETMFIVNRGYLMFSEGIVNSRDDKQSHKLLQITSCYPLHNFSQICGSNRFFRFPFLRDKLLYRLSPKFPPSQLRNFFDNELFGPHLTKNLALQVKEHPQAWGVLPMFLGNHRIWIENQSKTPPHNFLNLFIIKIIPFRSSIKLIHDTNHSCLEESIAEKERELEIVSRYKESGYISAIDNRIYDLYHVAKLFAIGPFASHK